MHLFKRPEIDFCRVCGRDFGGSTDERVVCQKCGSPNNRAYAIEHGPPRSKMRWWRWPIAIAAGIVSNIVAWAGASQLPKSASFGSTTIVIVAFSAATILAVLAYTTPPYSRLRGIAVNIVIAIVLATVLFYVSIMMIGIVLAKLSLDSL